MADTFEDLGIPPELVAGVEELGWDGPVGVQRDAVPVLRRGNNLIVHASAGSGATGAYGLGVLDRLLQETGDGLQALVLVPDAGSADATADSLARLAAPTPLTVRGHAPGWATDGAAILVTSPAAAAAGLRDSSLKLGDLRVLVVVGPDQLVGTEQWHDLETLLEAIPAAAQRVLVAGRLDDAIADLAERHVRRAMTVPARPVEEPETDADGVPVRYAVVPERRKVEAAVHLLPSLEADEIAIVCRSHDRADELGRALVARGIPVDGVPGAAAGDRRTLVLPRLEADQRSTRAAVLSFDVPFDAPELEALHGGGGVVLVAPREREHLVRIARRAGLPVRPVAVPEPAALTAAEAFRDRLRAILGGGDLAAELALVEPLLEEYAAVEVAAAAVRASRQADPGAARPASRTGAPAAPARGSASAPPPPGGETWVHLFMTVGSRDGVGPGDIVGAMTGEAGIAGEQVGKIEIRESHTTVEVATAVAARVIDALNGRSLKGRSLRVDYDRKERSARKPSGRDRRPGTGGSGGRGSGDAGPGRGPGRRGTGGRSGGRGPAGGTRRGR